jgi:hypothetical protein
MPKKKPATRRSPAKRESTAVESIRHTDKRKNIPTHQYSALRTRYTGAAEKIRPDANRRRAAASRYPRPGRL